MFIQFFKKGILVNSRKMWDWICCYRLFCESWIIRKTNLYSRRLSNCRKAWKCVICRWSCFIRSFEPSWANIRLTLTMKLIKVCRSCVLRLRPISNYACVYRNVAEFALGLSLIICWNNVPFWHTSRWFLNSSICFRTFVILRW